MSVKSTRQKGITLIALVITIIVLLILAGVSIATLTGENGILKQANSAKEKTIIGEEKEAINLAYTACKSKDYTKDVTSGELREELEKIKKNVQVTESGDELIILYEETQHRYKITQSGEIEEIEQEEISNNKPIKLKVFTGEDGKVILPIYKGTKCSINWGDGTITDEGLEEYKVATISSTKLAVSAPDPVGSITHYYPENERNKIKIVEITGNIPILETNEYDENIEYDLEAASKIIEIVEWGETGLIRITIENNNIQTIQTPSPKSFEKLEYFGWTSNTITSIPNQLFENANNLRRVNFIDCKNITNIPEDLFKNCGNLEEVCFNGAINLEEIPENLFKYNKNLKTLYEGFKNCTSLTKIPEKLFENNKELDQLYECFQNCTSLTEIPKNLFYNCSKVTSLNYIFARM